MIEVPWYKPVIDNLQFIAPIVTFVAGFFTSRWTMTKKERKDFEQQLFENGRDLMAAQMTAFQEFTTALQKYVNKDGEPTFDDFMSIAMTGEKYFYQQKIVSDAVLANKVDWRSRDNTLVPSVADTVEKALPSYYRHLQSIAKRKGFEFHGELKRENYESMYSVVEKFGRGPNGAAASAAT